MLLYIVSHLIHIIVLLVVERVTDIELLKMMFRNVTMKVVFVDNEESKWKENWTDKIMLK